MSCRTHYKKSLAALVFAAASTLLAGCNDDGGNPEPAPGNEGSGATVTEIGVATGNAATVTIGAAGGTATSADGKLSLVVPPGALAQDTAIGIQPITNTSPAGRSGAYRLLPEGTAFQKPVTLRIKYADQDTAGTTAGLLGIAYQRADRIWHWVNNPSLDSEAKTVSVETTHFSDWALQPRLYLTPSQATVKVGKSVGLAVQDCTVASQYTLVSETLMKTCTPISDLAGLVYAIEDWAVNGQPSGNSAVGTVTNTRQTPSATYTAPATRPSPATVAVSVKVSEHLGAPAALLVSNITIVNDGEGYLGSGHLQTEAVTATFDIDWTLIETLPDVRSYMANGTVTGSVHPEGCQPLPFSLPINGGTPTQPVSTLVVFNDTAVQPFANSHHFGIQGSPDTMLSLTCGEQTYSLPAATLVAFIAGGTCSPEAPAGSERVYHDNLDTLSGTWNCATTGMSGDWEFHRYGADAATP